MACMQHDADMEQRVMAAAEAGRKLVYVGSVDISLGTCSVGLEAGTCKNCMHGSS